MAASRPITPQEGFALITPLPLTTTDQLSILVEGHAWWGRHQARAEETMATTGEMTPCEGDPPGGAISTEEGEGEEQSQALGAEAGEDPEEGTTTWAVCGTQ